MGQNDCLGYFLIFSSFDFFSLSIGIASKMKSETSSLREKGVHPVGHVETGRFHRLLNVGGRTAGGGPGKDGGDFERALVPA